MAHPAPATAAAAPAGDSKAPTPKAAFYAGLIEEAKKCGRPRVGGFYLARGTYGGTTDSDVCVEIATGHVLILGPFHGQPAVVRIPFGKGVCGTACVEGKTQLVPNVHEHPNHIACDSASQSEIVVPVKTAEDKLVAVLDMDSPVLNGFDHDDQAGLETIAALLGAGCDWTPLNPNIMALKSDSDAPMCTLKKKVKGH